MAARLVNSVWVVFIDQSVEIAEGAGNAFAEFGQGQVCPTGMLARVKNREELAECVAAAEAGPLPAELMVRVDQAVNAG
jgi:hypothetical protein